MIWLEHCDFSFVYATPTTPNQVATANGITTGWGGLLLCHFLCKLAQRRGVLRAFIWRLLLDAYAEGSYHRASETNR
jgi:hypothetical protein